MPSILGVAVLGLAVITPLCAARAVLGASVAWLARKSEHAATPVAPADSRSPLHQTPPISAA
jgi:hypothetical protein